MAWYKIDDKLHSHPKARRASMRRGFIYIVAWPLGEEFIVKVGFTTSPSRWCNFMRHGAGLYQVTEFEDSRAAFSLEQQGHMVLRPWPRAFTSRDEGDYYLGVHGGWTECYRMRSPRIAALALVGWMRFHGWSIPDPKKEWVQECPRTDVCG